MADEPNTQAPAEGASVETTTEGSQPETQTQGSNATSTEQAGENQQGSNADAAASSDKGQSQNQDSKADSKPVSRRSAAYRISQLLEKNRTLKQQVNPAQQQDDWGDNTAQDDPKPDIQALIDAAVEKRLNPIVSESSKTADDAEINELFSGDKASERTEYEPQIRKYWELPQYKDVAAADLHAMLVGKNMDTIVQATKLQAVEDYKKAEKEARESSASGSTNISNRTGKSGKSVTDMTDEEFAAHNARVKAGLA